MRNVFTCIVLLFMVQSVVRAQGTIVEDTVILHLDYSDIDSIIVLNGFPSGLLPTDYELDVHRVVYETPDVDGSTTTASGLVLIPEQDSCALPMLAYLHGTKVKKDETFYYLRGEWHLGVIASTSGYVVVLPDYLGLGMSPGIHPYQHAETQASASVDIMRVARTICEQTGRPLNDQLFIMGYSQGGHAVLATHRKIQEELSDEFTVTASAPGSGPYDLSGSQLEMVASEEPYAQPGYLPYLIQSYQHVYGNLYDSIQQIYVPPYDEILPPLLDGSADMGQLNAVMPSVPRDIIRPDYADAFFTDISHPAYLALKDNDVYEWVPQAPVMFNYCRSDEEVTYQNTIVASEYMINAGAPHIEVIERDTLLGHFACAQPSLLYSKLWFDGMADFCGTSLNVPNPTKDARIDVYPNPNRDGRLHFSNPTPVEVVLYDLSGRIIGSAHKLPANGMLTVQDLPKGILIVQMRSREMVQVQRVVLQ